jgi:hypothetical protein
MTAEKANSSLRIDAKELKTRMEAGESVRVLDARAPQAWSTCQQRIRGGQRISADQFRPDSSWSEDELIVAYCE